MNLFALTDFQLCQIRNVNVRKEKNGPDELVTAIDLSIKAERVPLAAVAILFGVEPERAESAFYEGGDLRLLNLGPIPVGVEFENRYQVHIGRIEDRATKVSQFRVKPVGSGMFEVSLKVAVSQPSEEFFQAAIEYQLADQAPLKLEPVADLFDQQEDQPAAA